MAAADENVALRIAALVAGGRDGTPVPAWLAASMPALVGMVRAPRPAPGHDDRDLRDALDTVERAASNLAGATENPEVMRRLAAIDPSVPALDWAAILASAPEIARQAALALARVPGGEADPPTLPDRIRCAAIVAEAWQAVRGRRGVLDAAACRAADLLWRAAGRASLGDARALARWRAEFRALAEAETADPEAFAVLRAAVTARLADPAAIGTRGDSA